MELKIRTDEAGSRIGKGALFVRHAIKNGSFPGAYATNENNNSDFYISKLVLYQKVMGYSYEDAKKLIVLEDDGLTFEEAQKMILLQQDQKRN